MGGYTLGEVIGGPVPSAVAAKSAPEALRGRYLALSRLAVTVAGAVAPVALSGLLSAGPVALWLPLTGVGALGGTLATVIGRTVPAARKRVGTVQSAPGPSAYGTRAVHSSEPNLVRASSRARASSASVTLPWVRP